MRERILLTLFSSGIVIVFLPLSEELKLHPVWLLVIYLVFLTVVSALFQRKWLDVVLLVLTLSGFILGNLLYRGEEFHLYGVILPTAALLSFLILSFALLIGPIARIWPRTNPIYKWRRHIGVTAFLLAALHASVVFTAVFGRDFNRMTSVSFTQFGVVSLWIMFLLAITSWDYVQKHFNLKWWYAMTLITAVPLWGLGLRGVATEGERYLVFWIGVITWSLLTLPLMMRLTLILTRPWRIKLRNVKLIDGWKQLHRLVYLAYIAAAVHIWEGSVYVRSTEIKVAFLTLVSVVTLFHLLAWLKTKYERWGKERNKFINIEGRRFYLLDQISEFKVGKGRQFFIENTPIAVFNTGKKYIALYDKCQHQGGPLHQGKIEEGYIVCPWHGWQYGVDDGCAPPGFHDSVPFFSTLTDDEYVYVCLEPAKLPTTHFSHSAQS